VRRVRVDNSDQLDAREVGEYAGVIAPHHTDADDPDPQPFARAPLRGFCHLSFGPSRRHSSEHFGLAAVRRKKMRPRRPPYP
jgi:hypothetical protein